jgi:hypothetical protein
MLIKHNVLEITKYSDVTGNHEKTFIERGRLEINFLGPPAFKHTPNE